MQLNIDPRDSVYVARQPILDPSGHVFGYELLYRAAEGDTSCTAGAELASARVLTDTILNLGLDTLTDGLPAFINLTRPLLINDIGTLLPVGKTILELHEDISIDADVIEACRRLHGSGYSLALDDFAPNSDAEQLLPYVKFVKVDVLATPSIMWASLADRLLRHGVRLVAEKVETVDAAQAARAAGYTLFQGYFFCRPSTFSGVALPTRRMAYLSLLGALSEPNLTIGELEDLIKHDVSLCYRILRCVNSAAFGVRREIHSIRQALVLLGIGQIRKWALVWSMSGLNSGGTSEVVTIALLRARCCEIVGETLLSTEASSEYFLLGLCSLLDVMLGRPLDEALEEMPLSAPVRDALLGHSNLARTVLDLVTAYERGDWDEAGIGARDARLAASMMPAAYADALRWARELSRNAIAAA